MDNHILSRATKYLSKQRKRARWHKIISILAAIVVFGTTYALILPAITMEKTLICEEEEHTHTDACYTEQKVLVCQQEEGTEHTHTDECYQTEKVLACGKAEHTHTEECYKKVEGDPDADVETQSDWEDTIKQVELTGDWSEDVLAIANSQIGYKESTANYVEEDGVIRGYSRYGEWYGDPYGKWSGMFVSFCLNYAKVDNIPLQSDCNQWVADLQKEEYALYREADQYTPVPGDLIFFHMDTSSAYQEIADHVGLVVEVTSATGSTPAKIKTIEGDSDDSVQNVVYDLTDARILGYGQLPEEPKEAVADTSNDEESSDSVNEAQQGDETAADSADTEDENGDGKEAESEEDELSEEEQAMIDEVIAKIDALPSSQEIEDTLAAYEEDGLDDEYEAYYEEVYNLIMNVYVQYQDMGEVLQKQVTNRDKLLELEWIWGVMSYSATSSVDVTAVNSFNWGSYGGAFIIHSDQGAKVRDIISNSVATFASWYAIRIEEKNGIFFVEEIYTNQDGSKENIYASGTGFILLYNTTTLGTSVNVNVGDSVTVSGDFWKTTHNYNNGQVYGTVTFGSTATLKLEKDNSGKLTIVQGADTQDLITVNLYDYGSNINELYKENKNYPGFQQDNGTKTVYSTASSNFGNNITSDLSAGIAGLTNGGGTINTTTNSANSPISGAMKSTLGDDGYPVLSDGTSLEYLFSDGTYATKKNKENINGLFQYNDKTGAYTFNSRENHAQFNEGNDTFTLYDQIISSNFIMYPFGNFLPFNDIVKKSTQASEIDKEYFETIASSAQYKYGQDAGDEYGTLSTVLNEWISKMDTKYPTGWGAAQALNEYFNANVGEKNFHFENETELLNKVYSIDYDEPTDFFFGMEMEMNFMQPKGGLTGKDGKQPMIFYFTGDDDVWVYIDGQMFLDLSGIHRHVGGEIDFVNGVVKYYDLDVNTGDVSTTPSKTVKFENILSSSDGLNSNGTFEDYSTHTFKFYYMERGAGSGVCRMNFNFPLLRKNSISVTKELSVDESDKQDMLGNPDFKFQILKENGTDLFIGANTNYDIYNNERNLIGTGTTDENGVFTLKANQTAVFNNIPENAGKYFVRELLDPDAFSQYGTIFVNGSSQTTNYDVTVGSDQFKGVNSPLKDVSDGSTAFTFNNQVIFDKLGSLEIEKKVDGDTSDNPQFEFEVTIDGTPLPVGTTYTVGSETRSVTEEGIITLAAGEKAHISNIIAGSEFTVKEMTESAKGYKVTYEGSDASVTTDGGSARGVITTDAAVLITVTNQVKGTSITIPGTKNLELADGEEHEYSFHLEQVTDQTGDTLVESGTDQTATATLNGSGTATAPFAFTIVYREKDFSSLPVKLYYKVSESIAYDDFVTDYDKSIYVIEVEVKEDSNEELQAAITNIWKDGEPVAGSQIVFNNKQVRSLMIRKQVEGAETVDTEFRFTISLSQNGNPLNGEYSAVKTKSDMSTEDVKLTLDQNGQSTITLKHGESIKINGLPYGTQWKVTESDVEGYIVKYSICDGDVQEGEEAEGIVQIGNDSVTFTNITTYELPESGGSGTIWYTIGGLILMLGAFLMYRRIRMRKGGASSAD